MIRALLIFVATFYLVRCVRTVYDQQFLQDCNDKIGLSSNDPYIYRVRCSLLASQQQDTASYYQLHLKMNLREPLNGWKLTLELARPHLQLDGVELNSPVGQRRLAFHVDGTAVSIQEEGIYSATLDITLSLTDKSTTLGDSNLPNVGAMLLELLHVECLHCTSIFDPSVSARMCKGPKFLAEATLTLNKQDRAAQAPYYNGVVTLHPNHPLSSASSTCLVDFQTFVRIDDAIGATTVDLGTVVSAKHVIAVSSNSQVCVLRVSYLAAFSSPSPPRVLCTVCNEFEESSIDSLKKRSLEKRSNGPQDQSKDQQSTNCDDEDNDCPNLSGSELDPSGSGSGSASGDDIPNKPGSASGDDIPNKPGASIDVTPSTSASSTSNDATTHSPPHKTGTDTPSQSQAATTHSTPHSKSQNPTSSDQIKTNDVDTSKEPTSSDPSNNIVKDSTDSPGVNRNDVDIVEETDKPTTHHGDNDTNRTDGKNGSNSAVNPNLAGKPKGESSSVMSSGIWIGVGTVMGFLALCAVISVVAVVGWKRRAKNNSSVQIGQLENGTDGRKVVATNQTPRYEDTATYSVLGALPANNNENIAARRADENDQYHHLERQQTGCLSTTTAADGTNETGYDKLSSISTKPNSDDYQLESSGSRSTEV